MKAETNFQNTLVTLNLVCLANKNKTTSDVLHELDISYITLLRYLRKMRDNGIPIHLVRNKGLEISCDINTSEIETAIKVIKKFIIGK